MTFAPGVSGKRYPRLHIKLTQDDHDYVHALSLMGIGVRLICERLGERFKLGKPMVTATLYQRFGDDLLQKARGVQPSQTTVRARVLNNMEAEVKNLIKQIRGENTIMPAPILGKGGKKQKRKDGMCPKCNGLRLKWGTQRSGQVCWKEYVRPGTRRLRQARIARMKVLYG